MSLRVAPAPAELVDLDALARAVPSVDALAADLDALERAAELCARLASRLDMARQLVTARSVTPKPTAEPDRALNSHEVAPMVGYGEDWVRDHGKELGGVRRNGGPWRFTMHGVQRWLRSNMNGGGRSR